MSELQDKATHLLGLHRDPTLLTVVNVWDVISARVVADGIGTTALATASHSIAASYGYEDGEKIPVDLMIEACGRIAAATDLPVSADLEAGYGHPVETVRKALGVGIVGPEASDLISEAALGVEMCAFAEDIALTIHPHPTLGEGMMEAFKHALGEAVHVLNK